MSKVRSKGEGHIYKRGNTYSLQFDVNGKRKRISLKVKTLKEAQKKAKEMLSQVINANTKEQIILHIGEAKELYSENNIRLEDVWELYIKKSSQRSSVDTLENYKRQWHKFHNWLIDSYPNITSLNEVTSDISLEYGRVLDIEDKYSTSTFNQHRNTLISIFKVLISRITHIPNPWLEISRKTTPGSTRKELSVSELKMVLDKFDDDTFYLLYKEEMKLLFQIGIFTGLRLIDCVYLKWADINFDADMIHCIPRKTRRFAKSISIPIHPTLKEALISTYSNNTDEQYVLHQIAKRYDSYPKCVRADAVKVFKVCGFKTSIQVDDRKKKTNLIGFHSLRHSFVTICAKQGVALAVVQAIVGHTSPAMTRNYTHVGNEAMKQAITAIPAIEDSISKPISKEECIERALSILKTKKDLTTTEQKVYDELTSYY